MDRFPVYIPNLAAPQRVRLAVASIDPKSAIVGSPDASDANDRILIYYEGNRYGAENIVTFADRAMLAAGRLAEKYPTVARCAAPQQALTLVGWFSAGHGVDVTDANGLIELAKWLGMFDGERLDSDALHAELRLSR
jgi:hypothetical protein